MTEMNWVFDEQVWEWVSRRPAVTVQLTGRTDAQVISTMVHENTHTITEAASPAALQRMYAVVGLSSRAQWRAGSYSQRPAEMASRAAEECLLGTQRDLPSYSCSTFNRLMAAARSTS